MKPPFRSGSAPRGSDALTARVDFSTTALLSRLKAGEVAVIDHLDLDRVSAEALLEKQPAAVLNATKSISGRYPNLGPEILVAAGIPLIDDLGSQVMTISDGATVHIEGAVVHDASGDVIAEGILQTPKTIAEASAAAQDGMAVQMEAFASNTTEYLRTERDLILNGAGVPETSTRIKGRHALVVVRGYNYREDLAMLKSYVREFRPVLIGVDGGADVLLDAGYTPDVIVGDMETASDLALACGAELIANEPDGKTAGQERLDRRGLEYTVFPSSGTSEDLAMLLADENGAELIVTAGTHESLIEFLDQGRENMASTFLTRLRIGGKLIDAAGVSELYRHRISNWTFALLILSGISALAAAILATPAGQALLSNYFSF